MAKPLNGATKWMVFGFTVLMAFSAVIVWGVRQEGRINYNNNEIMDIKADTKIIKEDVKKILEKM